jgi:hypothetical protein
MYRDYTLPDLKTLTQERKTPQELCEEANHLLDTFILPALREKESEMREVAVLINTLIESGELISQEGLDELVEPVIDKIREHVQQTIELITRQIDEKGPQGIFLRYKFWVLCTHNIRYSLGDQYVASRDGFLSSDSNASRKAKPHFEWKVFDFSAMRFKP